MKRLIVLFLVAAFLLAGCAKKVPEAVAPTPVSTPAPTPIPVSTPAMPSAPSEGQAMPAAAPQEEVKPIGDKRCMDSDGGKNYAVKGNISGVNNFGIKYEKEDICVTGNNGYLNEYFCSDTGKPQTDVHKCEKGCKDGVCI